MSEQGKPALAVQECRDPDGKFIGYRVTAGFDCVYLYADSVNGLRLGYLPPDNPMRHPSTVFTTIAYFPANPDAKPHSCRPADKPSPSPRPFQVGDVVRLRSGWCDMVVMGVSETKDRVVVCWMTSDGSTVEVKGIPMACLDLVKAAQ